MPTVKWPEFTVTLLNTKVEKVVGLPEVLTDGTLVFRLERTVPTGRTSITRTVIVRAYAAGCWHSFTLEFS